MSANFCMWGEVQLLSKCCQKGKSRVEILIVLRFVLSRDMCMATAWSSKCGDQGKGLDIALQANCSFQIWNDCWNSDGLCLIRADHCYCWSLHRGVEVKIQRFDVIVIDGNAVDVWNTYRKHCTSISWLFLAYKTAMHDGGFVSASNGDLFAELSICMNTHWVLSFSNHDCLCFSILSILYWANTFLCETGKKLSICY